MRGKIEEWKIVGSFLEQGVSMAGEITGEGRIKCSVCVCRPVVTMLWENASDRWKLPNGDSSKVEYIILERFSPETNMLRSLKANTKYQYIFH